MGRRVVHFLKVGIVSYCLNTLLQWDDLVIAGHYHDGAEL